MGFPFLVCGVFFHGGDGFGEHFAADLAEDVDGVDAGVFGERGQSGERIFVGEEGGEGLRVGNTVDGDGDGVRLLAPRGLFGWGGG